MYLEYFGDSMQQITSLDTFFSNLRPCSPTTKKTGKLLETSDQQLSIGQLANVTGETVKTLRYWTDLGLLPASREENQYCVYQPDVTERVEFIRNAQSLGFTLSEILELQAACNDDCKDCSAVRDKIALQLERVRVGLKTLRNLESTLITQLERVDQNPNPSCSDTGCEFIAAPQT